MKFNCQSQVKIIQFVNNVRLAYVKLTETLDSFGVRVHVKVARIDQLDMSSPVIVFPLLEVLLCSDWTLIFNTRMLEHLNLMLSPEEGDWAPKIVSLTFNM